VTGDGIETKNTPAGRAAAALCRARLRRYRFDRLPVDLVLKDESEAYAVQELLHACLATRGWGRVVGYKIGCTTPIMQEYLGIHNPCAGGVFDTTIQREPGRIVLPRALRVGVECEIAVLLRSDLGPSDRPFDRETVASAVGACMAAVEIVEDRYVDYPSLDTPTLIADDFFGAGCVLGPPVEAVAPGDLSAATASMTINGREVGSGVGTDILGHPLDALAWLANNMAGRGHGLRQGEFVLLGSLVQTHWVEPGDEVTIMNEPLGAVHVAFV